MTPSILDTEMEILRMEREAPCATKEASCVCVLAAKHEGPHECDCGGSWAIEDGTFSIVAFPVRAGLYPQGRSAA